MPIHTQTQNDDVSIIMEDLNPQIPNPKEASGQDGEHSHNLTEQEVQTHLVENTEDTKNGNIHNWDENEGSKDKNKNEEEKKEKNEAMIIDDWKTLLKKIKDIQVEEDVRKLLDEFLDKHKQKALE